MKNNHSKLPAFPQPIYSISLLILFALALDQITKIWAAASFSSPFFITSWLRLISEQNVGIAFSIPVPYPILIILNVILLGLLIYFLVTQLNWKHPLSILIFAFFTAGALGNLADRLRLGYVIDFISVGIFPIFNLADSFITVSVFLLLLFYDKINRSNKD